MTSKIVLGTLAGLCVATLGGLCSQPANADEFIRTITTTTSSSYMEPATTIIERPAVIERVVESPVVTERVIERPVVTERVVERPVMTERVVERPMVIERAVERPIILDSAFRDDHLLNLGLFHLLHLDLF